MSFLQNVSEIYATEHVSIYRFESSSKEESSALPLKTKNTMDTKRRIILTRLRLHARCPDVAVMTDPQLHQNP